jgi:hypothetical protein
MRTTASPQAYVEILICILRVNRDSWGKHQLMDDPSRASITTRLAQAGRADAQLRR